MTALNDLTDVTISSPSANEFLVFNGSVWANQGGGSKISDLTAILGANLAAGDVFAVEDIDAAETKRVSQAELLNVFAATSHTHTESQISDLQAYLLDISGENLAALADVTITGIAAGELLKWNGSAWINNTLAEAGIAAVGHTHLEADISDLRTYLLADGTQGLSADWDAGAHRITAQQLAADIASGTAPLVIASTTLVANLNADLIDGIEGAELIQRDGSVNFTANQSMNSNRLTNLAAPSTDNDAASKGYVDGAVEGRKWKDSVRAATTTAGVLASDFENGDAVDGVTLATGDRLLIKNQSTGSENGIFTVNASGVPTRADDLASGADASGAVTFVEEGTANGNTQFICTNNKGSDSVGTDALNWSTYGTGGGGGETNTASNVGAAGVGTFKQKTGVDMEFRNINAGSAKITVTLDAGNNEIDVNLGSVAIADLSDVSGTTGSGSVPVLQTSPTLLTPRIQDAGADHNYVLAVSDLAADRTLTLPLLAGNDTFVFADFAQTLANKTLTTPTIASFASATHNHQAAAGGGQLDHGAALAGLTDDDHAQYALLAGRSGGQAIIGGTASGENLTLESTSHATKGHIQAKDDLQLDKVARYDAEYDNGNSGTTPTVDWNNGNFQKITLTGNATFTFTAPAGPGWFTLRVIQDTTAGRTVTWPAAVVFPTGGTESLSADTNAQVRLFSFHWDGAEYRGGQSPVYAS